MEKSIERTKDLLNKYLWLSQQPYDTINMVIEMIVMIYAGNSLTVINECVDEFLTGAHRSRIAKLVLENLWIDLIHINLIATFNLHVCLKRTSFKKYSL